MHFYHDNTQKVLFIFLDLFARARMITVEAKLGFLHDVVANAYFFVLSGHRVIDRSIFCPKSGSG